MHFFRLNVFPFHPFLQLPGTGAFSGAPRGRRPRRHLLVDLQPRLLLHTLQPVRETKLKGTKQRAIFGHLSVVFSCHTNMLILTHSYDAIGLSGLCWMSALVSALAYGFVLELVPDVREASDDGYPTMKTVTSVTTYS